MHFLNQSRYCGAENVTKRSSGCNCHTISLRRAVMTGHVMLISS